MCSVARWGVRGGRIRGEGGGGVSLEERGVGEVLAGGVRCGVRTVGERAVWGTYRRREGSVGYVL